MWTNILLHKTSFDLDIFGPNFFLYAFFLLFLTQIFKYLFVQTLMGFDTIEMNLVLTQNPLGQKFESFVFLFIQSRKDVTLAATDGFLSTQPVTPQLTIPTESKVSPFL